MEVSNSEIEYKLLQRENIIWEKTEFGFERACKAAGLSKSGGR